MKTIRFKSIPEYFRKEYLGLKNNTLRKTDNGLRFSILDDFSENLFSMLNIEIENTETHEVFTRHITDVTKFDDYYIISWKDNDNENI